MKILFSILLFLAFNISKGQIGQYGMYNSGLTFGACPSDSGSIVIATQKSGLRLTKIDSLKNIVWQKSFRDSVGPWGFNLTKDLTGFTVVGFVNQNSMYRGLFAKLDMEGNLLWARKLDTLLGASEFRSVFQRADSSYLIFGTLTNRSGNYKDDLILICLDKNGNSVWQKIYGGLSTDESAVRIFQTKDSGYVLAARGQYFIQYDYSVLLMRFNKHDSLLWTKNYAPDNTPFGPSNPEISLAFIKDATLTSDNGIAVSANSFQDQLVEFDYNVMKFDSAGNWQWSKRIDYDESDSNEDLIETSDGGIVVTGAQNGGGSLDGRAVLYKFSSTGNLLWCNATGDSVVNINFGVFEDSYHNLNVFGQKNNTNYNALSFTLSIYDSSGAGCGYIEPVGTVTNCPLRWVNSLVPLTTNFPFNLINCGHTITYSHNPMDNLCSGITLGTEAEIFSDENILIYPLPAYSYFSVYSSSLENEVFSVNVIDQLGKIVFSGKDFSNNDRINTELTSGIYYLEIKGKTKRFVKKLVVI